MPMLLTLLSQPNEKSTRVLKSRGMECAGLIGMAVGKQQFSQDAVTLANLLVQIQSESGFSAASCLRQLRGPTANSQTV